MRSKFLSLSLSIDGANLTLQTDSSYLAVSAEDAPTCSTFQRTITQTKGLLPPSPLKNIVGQ